MHNQTSLLINKNQIEKLLEELITKEAEVVEDLKRIMPYAGEGTVKASLGRRLKKGEECLVALKGGFLPIDSGFFTRTDVKDRWSKKEVDRIVKSMPLEVLEVWDKAKKLGIFKSFAVSGTGGDPILVGRTGGKNFLLAGWIDFGRGVSLGIAMRI